MRRALRMDADGATCDLRLLAGRERLGVAVSLPAQPARHRGWCIERDVPRKAVQRIEREVVGVRVGEQDRVEYRQGIERDPRSGDPRKEATEMRIEVWVGEDP